MLAVEVRLGIDDQPNQVKTSEGTTRQETVDVIGTSELNQQGGAVENEANAMKGELGIKDFI